VLAGVVVSVLRSENVPGELDIIFRCCDLQMSPRWREWRLMSISLKVVTLPPPRMR